MESKFSDLRASPVFENLGDVKLQILVDNFREIQLKRDCKIVLINAEWQVLKSFMVPLIKNNKALPYPDIWKQVFTKSELKSEYKNVLPIQDIICQAIYKC